MNPVPARRRVLAGLIASAAGMAAAPRAHGQQQATAEKPANPAHQALTAIHYEIDFKASPQRFYQAILDQKQFAAFSGLPATIDPTPGGIFSQFGGVIVGRNIELVANQRIVQAWRPTHWDPGTYSVVHFEIKPHAAELTLIFDHTGFPAGDYDSLDSGWYGHYWEPLKKFLV
jgi:activator of HSP90 ATPase